MDAAHVNSDLDISGWDSWFDQMMINAAASIGGRDGTWLLQSVPFQGGAGKMLYSEFSNRQLLGHFPISSLIVQVDWDVCPPDLPCCNEYGYCRSRVAHHHHHQPLKRHSMRKTGGVGFAEFPRLQWCQQWGRIA